MLVCRTVSCFLTWPISSMAFSREAFIADTTFDCLLSSPFTEAAMGPTCLACCTSPGMLVKLITCHAALVLALFTVNVEYRCLIGIKLNLMRNSSRCFGNIKSFLYVKFGRYLVFPLGESVQAAMFLSNPTWLPWVWFMQMWKEGILFCLWINQPPCVDHNKVFHHLLYGYSIPWHRFMIGMLRNLIGDLAHAINNQHLALHSFSQMLC